MVITLFSCGGNYNEIQKMNLTDGAPVAEGLGINLKYTDSGKVVTNLITSRLKDYSNKSYPYREFPEGVEVIFWEQNGKSIVTSDYAIQYEASGLIDLRDNVVVVTKDSTILEAQQLYWDQKSKWIFTDAPYRIKFKNGSYNDGARFDSSEDFTNFISRKNNGVQIIDKKELKDEE